MDQKSGFDDNALSCKLKDYFKNNIKLALKTENIVFIVTKEDIFYELDIYDENVRLFLSMDDNSILEKFIVKELCYKEIIDLINGEYHYIARTNDNKVYCWGNNYWAQLGNGREDEDPKVYNKPELNVLLSDLSVSAVKCGANHSLALTKSGDLYFWGSYKIRRIVEDPGHHLMPFKVNGFDNEIVIEISCGLRHCMALTKSGRVYSWGSNECGQLGVESLEDFNTPQIIQLNDVLITKISCGSFHSLLLSNDGVVYSFGYNNCGQIGNGNREIQVKPIKLAHKESFIEIASHWNNNLSAALSSDSIYYGWGDCDRGYTLVPIRTKYKSFNEIFAHNFEHNLDVSEELIKFSDLYFQNGYYKSHFKETEKLGSGSYGTVFKASVLKNKTEYFHAIKKISFENLKFKFDILREFYNFSVVNKLSKQYVVPHSDAWLEYSQEERKIYLYIVMELCDKTLEDIIDEFDNNSMLKNDEILTPIGFYIASQLFIEILESVQHLHKHNIIHRDLNPYNIMLKKDDESHKIIKIVDFGLIAFHEFAEKSHSGDKGQAKYMAPEIDSGLYDTKADIFSLGIILTKLFDMYYEM
jgi:alpha-tubulin suppressor-like RCC1 family protein